MFPKKIFKYMEALKCNIFEATLGINFNYYRITTQHILSTSFKSFIRGTNFPLKVNVKEKSLVTWLLLVPTCKLVIVSVSLLASSYC